MPPAGAHQAGPMTRKRRRKANRPNAPATLDTAIRLHRAGRLTEAEQAYRRVLDASPDSVQAVYLFGVVTRQLGRADEAAMLFRRAVSYEPDHAAALAELAKLYQEQGLLEASLAVLRRLVAIRPDLGDLYNNMGIVLRRLKRPGEARDAYLKAIDLGANRAETHYNLGCVMQALGQHHEAAASYREAIALEPGMADAHRRLAGVLRSSGNLKAAGEAIEGWLRHDPDNPVACHMASALSGQDIPARASDAYIRGVFGRFAETYDEELKQLGYQGPRLIADAVSVQLGGKGRQLTVLDAGCGTGLCGPVLRSISRQLVGVDLSAEMVERARTLGVYDDLVVAELIGYLNRQRSRFDLIVAADTFNYFGALEELLAAARGALREAGLLIFTLEQLDASGSAVDHCLNPHGRYSHTEDYVKRCTARCQLTVNGADTAVLRRESGRPAVGLVVRAQKK